METMFVWFDKAGHQFWLIIILSVISLAIIGERIWALRREVIVPGYLLNEVKKWVGQGGITSETLAKLQAHSYLGEVFASALANSNSSREITKEAIEETGRVVAHKLERFLPALATIATIAPLVGLFGTVIGMMTLFANFQEGNNVAQFAQGISEALINTAGGIFVAVPAMIAYRYFRGKVDDMLIDMEQQAIKLVEILHGERN